MVYKVTINYHKETKSFFTTAKDMAEAARNVCYKAADWWDTGYWNVRNYLASNGNAYHIEEARMKRVGE